MKKMITILAVLAVAVIFSANAIAAEIHKVPIEEAAKKEVYPSDIPTGAEAPGIPYTGGDITESPGLMIGTSYYDYQTNGSTGSRIAKHECGTHLAWMNGIGQWIGNRWVYYNFIDPSGNLGWSEGTAVSTVQGAGYTTIDYDGDGNAVVAFHNSGNLGVTVAIDAACGFGLFTLYDVPHQFPGENDFFWPYVAVDDGGHIQVVSTENEPDAGALQKVGHTYATVDNPSTWEDLTIYDTLMDISGMVTASPVSGKVAIVYTDPIDYTDPTQYNNDIAYIESPNGEAWFYNMPVNVTNYLYEDTIRAYTDVDACYDYNDNLHILWNAPGYWADEGTITLDACFLHHWSSETGITEVYNAWFPSFPGAWNRSASKMSISAHPNGNSLVALWTHFDDIDVSAGGFSNGELYISVSNDNGATWIDPINITETNTEGCFPGDCDSEHWASMAEFVDDSIYVTFTEDKDAGGVPQTEGTQTENPIRYYSYYIADLIQTDVKEGESSLPEGFSISQNYPNPFNASTNISFNLGNEADVKLDVYNVLGEKVETVVNGNFAAGEHTVNWDASEYTSGVYFYKFSANGATETNRMVLLK
ncbi:MAG: T9SS type A sorting domain-containing protein [candidate division Zixibacteria bacterium]|nr:T9SS type A sorting domain-containing protein [candidate division Zixibacteria bacterium]